MIRKTNYACISLQSTIKCRVIMIFVYYAIKKKINVNENKKFKRRNFQKIYYEMVLFQFF